MLLLTRAPTSMRTRLRVRTYSCVGTSSVLVGAEGLAGTRRVPGGGGELLLGQRAAVGAMIVLSAECIALLLSAALSLMSCSSRASLRKLRHC